MTDSPQDTVDGPAETAPPAGEQDSMKGTTVTTNKQGTAVRVTAVRGLENVIAGDTRISTVDGAAGSLIYSGYEIRELAAHTSFAEAVYLLWPGELPTEAELDASAPAWSPRCAFPHR